MWVEQVFGGGGGVGRGSQEFDFGYVKFEMPVRLTSTHVE